MPPIWLARWLSTSTLSAMLPVSADMLWRLAEMVWMACWFVWETEEASMAWTFSSFMAVAMASWERCSSRKESAKDCMVR